MWIYFLTLRAHNYSINCCQVNIIILTIPSYAVAVTKIVILPLSILWQELQYYRAFVLCENCGNWLTQNNLGPNALLT